jgi:hypothetical protein
MGLATEFLTQRLSCYLGIGDYKSHGNRGLADRLQLRNIITEKYNARPHGPHACATEVMQSRTSEHYIQKQLYLYMLYALASLGWRICCSAKIK